MQRFTSHFWYSSLDVFFGFFLCLTVPRPMEDSFIPQPRCQTTQDSYFNKADPQNPSVRFLPFILTGFIRTLIDFFAASGVQLGQPDRDQFRYLRVAFSSQLKSKVDNILVKDTPLCGSRYYLQQHCYSCCGPS